MQFRSLWIKFLSKIVFLFVKLLYATFAVARLFTVVCHDIPVSVDVELVGTFSRRSFKCFWR